MKKKKIGIITNIVRSIKKAHRAKKKALYAKKLKLRYMLSYHAKNNHVDRRYTTAICANRHYFH